MLSVQEIAAIVIAKVSNYRFGKINGYNLKLCKINRYALSRRISSEKIKKLKRKIREI